MRKSSLGLMAAPLLLLTACEEEAPEADTTETGGEAAGELLGGTISDDMIPLEELTSTSPRAEPTQSAPTSGGDTAQAESETQEAAAQEAGAPEEAPPPAVQAPEAPAEE